MIISFTYVTNRYLQIFIVGTVEDNVESRIISNMLFVQIQMQTKAILAFSKKVTKEPKV